MSIEKAEAAQAATETMLKAVAADPEQQQQLSAALLQAQSDLGEGVAIVDPQTQRFVYVNDALCQLYGYSAAELLALPSFLTLIVPEEQSAFRTRLSQRQQGQPMDNHYELAVCRKDGARIIIEVAITQIPGPNGPQLVTLIRDITARKQTEEALRQAHAVLEQQVQERTAALGATNEKLIVTLAEQQRITAALQESESRYRLLAEHATDVIMRYALDGTFLYVSPAIRTFLGYEPEELLGRSVWELFHPEDAPRIVQVVNEASAQGTTATYTYRVRHKDGHYLWGETNSQPVRDAVTGEIQAVVAVARDITARKQVEEALRHSEERFRVALAHSPITIFHQDLNLRYTWVYNPTPGFCVEDMLGKRDDELLPSQEAASLMAVKQQALASRQRVHQEVSYVFQGITYFLDLMVEPLWNAAGQLVGLTGAGAEVTARKQAAEALRAADVRLRSHIEHSPLAVIEWDHELRVIQWSLRADQLFGWTAAEVMGKRRHEWQLVVAEDDARIQEAINPFLTTASPQPKNQWEVHQNRNYTKDGQILHCEWYNSFLYDEAGRFTSILSLVQDVTAREQAKEAQLRLAAIVESSDDAIISKSLDGVITSWNAAAERLFGYRAEEIVGQSILRLVPADRNEEEQEILKRLRRGEHVDRLETERRTKAGRLLDVSITSSPLRNERGVIIGASKIVRDITARKQAEAALARAHTDLRQIAYIAAHDLQEPVRQVGLYTQKIAKRDGEALDGDTREAMDFIVKGTRRMVEQLNDLMQYLEVDIASVERIPTDCEAVLQRALDHVRPAIISSGATVTYAPLPTLHVSPMHLQLVFQELLDNALKFHDTASPQVHVWAVREARGWRFAVRDSGIGIDLQFAGQLFGFFKRLTRDRYPGTGMGLAVCKKIIERHGGRIWLEPTSGGGLTVNFTISDNEEKTSYRL